MLTITAVAEQKIKDLMMEEKDSSRRWAMTTPWLKRVMSRSSWIRRALRSFKEPKSITWTVSKGPGSRLRIHKRRPLVVAAAPSAPKEFVLVS